MTILHKISVFVHVRENISDGLRKILIRSSYGGCIHAIHARLPNARSPLLYLRIRENRDATAGNRRERERRDAERREMRGIQSASTLNYVHNVRMTAIVVYIGVFRVWSVNVEFSVQ